MGEEDMQKLANLIGRAIITPGRTKQWRELIRSEVEGMAAHFPLFAQTWATEC